MCDNGEEMTRTRGRRREVWGMIAGEGRMARRRRREQKGSKRREMRAC